MSSRACRSVVARLAGRGGTVALALFLMAALVPRPASAESEVYAGERFGLDVLGYGRAGIGYRADGGDQVCAQLPGARAKYRLGNECEVFAEFGAVARVDRVGGEPLAELAFRVDYFAGSTNEFRTEVFNLQELYARVHLPDGDGPLAGAVAWAGTRFYRRNDIHINDFFYWTGVGTGIGLEAVPLGFGELSLAYFISADDDVEDLPRESDKYHRFDVRLEKLGVGGDGGQLTLAADLRLRGAAPSDAPEFGTQLVARYERTGVLGGTLAHTLQVGTGAATSLNNFANVDAAESDVAGRVVSHWFFNLDNGFSGQIAGLFEAQSAGNEWLSLGARPVYAFTPWLSLAVEAGVDLAFGDGEGTRVLGKGTLALELKRGTAFFDRPVLRAFVTAFGFDRTAERLGIAPELADRSAVTYGIQVEHFF